MDFKFQKGNNKNVLIIVCSNCGELFEDFTNRVDEYYDSVVCCPYCSTYNNL